MENDQESRAYSEADQQTMPNPTVASHPFVIVFGHQSDCIAALRESKRRSRLGFYLAIARKELSRDALSIAK
jgi:hypothetical protein